MHAADSIPLLLAADDIWRIVIFIVFMALYGIGQLITAGQQAKKKPPARRQPRPPQVPGDKAPDGKAAAPQPAGQADALRREVDEFLRRAQGKPPLEEKPNRPQPKPQPRKQAPTRPTTTLAGGEPKPTSIRVPQPPKAPEPEIPLRKGSVAEHVASHISSKKIVDHASQLGDKVALADDRLESRLREKFDHQLGSLKKRESSTPTESQQPNVAEEIAALLSSPSGMRQLIIAKEILERPNPW